MDLSIPFPDAMNYCLGWNPGNLPRYEIRSLFQNDSTDFTENKDSANIYVNESISAKHDIVSEKLEKSLEVSDIDEEFHEFSDVFKSDISHENYELKVLNISNNTEKHDILAENSEETLEVSNTDDEFHEFRDVFKSNISHENYDWKVLNISNNPEKHDILAEKSKETLEVSDTDEEFHGFSDVNSDITDMYMNENHEWKILDKRNISEKGDIVSEKSEKSMEVSDNDEDFHEFSIASEKPEKLLKNTNKKKKCYSCKFCEKSFSEARAVYKQVL